MVAVDCVTNADCTGPATTSIFNRDSLIECLAGQCVPSISSVTIEYIITVFQERAHHRWECRHHVLKSGIMLTMHVSPWV